MKKFTLCIALAFVLVMGVSSTSMAAGVQLENSFCNDIWVAFGAVDAGVYSCHGYEYGCGYEDRFVDGTLRVVGGIAYFGLVGGYGTSCAAGDYGCFKNENVAISLSTKTGTGMYEYHYLTSGVPDGHGATGISYTMTFPVPPPPTAEAAAFEPDATEK